MQHKNRFGSDLNWKVRSIALAAIGVGTLAVAGAGLTGCSGTPGVAPAVPLSSGNAAVPSGPILGYIWTGADATLRPILGVKGSSQVGQSIVPAGVYVAGAGSTVSSVGLVEDESGALFALHLPSPNAVRVGAGVAAHAQISFASSGTTAIAYAAGGGTISVITGLPNQAQMKTIAVPAGVQLASAVVSDAGAVLIAGQGSPGMVGVLSAAGQFTRVTSVASLGGMNFVPGSDDALVADAGANTVSLLHSVSGAASVAQVSASGINQPVAIAASQDRNWAVVANAGDNSLVRIDLKSGTPAAKLNCACAPTQLSSLAGSGTFRVNELGAGPVWMFDVNGASPQLLFVPAISLK